MRKLLALLLLIASPAWAVDLCTVQSIGAGDRGTGSISPGTPVTYVPGDALLLWTAAAVDTDTMGTSPSGYTLVKQGSINSRILYAKIAGPSESSVSLDWTGTSSSGAQIVAIHNPQGFPNVASLLGDSAASTESASTFLTYGALTVTQGTGCALRFGAKFASTANVATALAVSSGWVTAGFFPNTAGITTILGAEMFVGAASTWTEKFLAVTGNSDNSSGGMISVTLLSGDNIPTTPSFTDKTGQAINTLITSSSVVLAGFTNYTKLVVGAGSDSGCAFSLNGAAYSSATQYPFVGDTLAAEVTSGGAATTKNCVATLGDGTTVSDTFSVSTNASDTTAPTCSVAPTAGSTSAFGTTVTATCSDAVDATVTHIIGVVADGATAPTGAQLDACTGGAVIASSCNSGSQTNGVSKSLTTPSVLSASTAYDVYHTVKDNSNNYKTPPVKMDITTNASDQNVPVLLVDHFAGTDGTSILAHTPDTIAAGTSYHPLTGTMVITTNKASVSANSQVFIDVANADHVSDIQWTAAASQIAYLGLRATDSSNYLRCAVDVGANTIAIQRRFSGTTTTLASAAFISNAGTTYRLTALATPGDVLGCAIDGVEKVTFTTTDFNTGTLLFFGVDGAAATFDDWYVHLAYDALNSSGFVPDDPSGILNGLNIGTNSAFWVKPANNPATICSIYSFYAGGSLYCVPQSGTTAINMELFNTTTNALSTIALNIINPGSGAVAPTLNTIPDETVVVNIDPGPRDLTQYLTAGQPAPTWSLTAGYSVSTNELCPGRILSPTGTVSGICTIPGTYSVTARALNASGSASKSFSEIVTADTVPDGFSFTDLIGVTGLQVTSPCWTVSGINYTTTVTFSGATGAYNKNGAGFGTGSTTVVNGDILCIHDTAASPSVTDTLTVGGVPSTWTIVYGSTTDANQITFTNQTNLATGATVTSNCQTIAGLAAGVSINITLDSGSWTKSCNLGAGYVASTSGSVKNNDSIGLRHTASSSNGASVTQTFVYGNRSAQFSSTTISGALPTCSAIPDVSAAVDDVFTLDLNAYSTGVNQFTVGTLPNGITASGAVISGVFTTGQGTEAVPFNTTIGGSNAFGSCSTSIDFVINPTPSHEWTPVTPPTSTDVWTRIPKVNE